MDSEPLRHEVAELHPLARRGRWPSPGKEPARRFLRFLALLALLVSAPGEGQGASRLTVTLEDGRLSVSATTAPLKQVLAEIARLGDIRVSVEARLESQFIQENVTVAFEALPLEEGLRRLLRDRSYIFVYSRRGLAEIAIFTSGTGDFRPLAEVSPRFSKTKSRPRVDRSTKAVEPDLAELARFQTEALGHPDPLRRISALDKLAASRDQMVGLNAALQVLERERHPEVLEAALDLLVRIKESVPLDPILKMATDPGPAIRRRALLLLDDHGGGDPRVEELLITLARDDQDPTVREAAGLLLKDPKTR